MMEAPQPAQEVKGAVPPPVRIPFWERRLSWLERRAAWHLDWGEGRRPGLAFFYLNRPELRPGGRWGRMALVVFFLLTGLLLGGRWWTASAGALWGAPVAIIVGFAMEIGRKVRRVLRLGLLRELAATPVGGAEVIRDMHLTVIRNSALIGVGWLAGHIMFAPYAADGIVFALLFLLLMPPLLWRISVLMAIAVIGADNRRLTGGRAAKLMRAGRGLKWSVLTSSGKRIRRLLDQELDL